MKLCGCASIFNFASRAILAIVTSEGKVRCGGDDEEIASLRYVVLMQFAK